MIKASNKKKKENVFFFFFVFLHFFFGSGVVGHVLLLLLLSFSPSCLIFCISTAKIIIIIIIITKVSRMLEDYGTMTLAEVAAPAIKLAREGFPMYWHLHFQIERYKVFFFLKREKKKLVRARKMGKALSYGITNPSELFFLQLAPKYIHAFCVYAFC